MQDSDLSGVEDADQLPIEVGDTVTMTTYVWDKREYEEHEELRWDRPERPAPQHTVLPRPKDVKTATYRIVDLFDAGDSGSLLKPSGWRVVVETEDGEQMETYAKEMVPTDRPSISIDELEATETHVKLAEGEN